MLLRRLCSLLTFVHIDELRRKKVIKFAVLIVTCVIGKPRLTRSLKSELIAAIIFSKTQISSSSFDAFLSSLKSFQDS